MSRRGRVTIAVLIGVFLFFTLLGWLVNAWTDWLWFAEVKHTEVFTNVLRTRLALFAVFGLAMTLIVGGNLYLAYRLRPLLRPHSPEQATLERYRMVLTPRIGTWIALTAILIGFFAGLSAQGRWSTWMLFRNSQPFGVKDPIFHVDVGFYVFEYPFWRYLLGFGFTAVVLAVVGSIAIHYLFGGIRLQGVGDRMTTAARAHLTALVALFVLFKAIAYVLDRRALLLDHNDKTGLYGAGYTSINALLPAKEILSYISIVVAIAIIVFSNAMMRNLLWPGVSLALLGISAIAIGGIYPWSVQTFSVNPSLRDKERTYIKYSRYSGDSLYGQYHGPAGEPGHRHLGRAQHPAVGSGGRVGHLHPTPAGTRLLPVRPEAGYRPVHPQRQDPGLRGRPPRDRLQRPDPAAERMAQPAHRLHSRLGAGGRAGEQDGLRRPAVFRVRLPRHPEGGPAGGRRGVPVHHRADPGRPAAHLLRRAVGRGPQ
jgi:hypothetical protein